MRRIIFAAMSTVTALVLLFSYHTSTELADRRTELGRRIRRRRRQRRRPPATRPRRSGSSGGSGGAGTYTGDVGGHPVGPGPGRRSPWRTARSPRPTPCVYPTENPRDQEINSYAVPAAQLRGRAGPERQHRRRLRRDGDERRLHPVAAVRDRPGAPVTATGTAPRIDHPRRAFVEQVMGLPVSVHVRGPRARGDRGRRRGRPALRRPAGGRRAVQHVAAGEPGEPDPARRAARWRTPSPGCARSPRSARRRPGVPAGAFSAWLPGPDGVPALRPDRAGQGLGRRSRRSTGCSHGSPSWAPTTCWCPPAATSSSPARAPTPPTGRSASRTRATAPGPAHRPAAPRRRRDVRDGGPRPAHRRPGDRGARVRAAVRDGHRPRPHLGGRLRDRGLRPGDGDRLDRTPCRTTSRCWSSPTARSRSRAPIRRAPSAGVQITGRCAS